MIAIIALGAPACAFAQGQSQSGDQQSPPAQNDSQRKININDPPPPPPAAEAAPAPEPAKPVAFDPLGAEKDIEVGNFYSKKGNYDAAIERFQDAARKHAGYAKPYLLMAETYEKKDDAADALKAYREFLKLYPQSPDRKRVEGRIADLQKKAPPEEKKEAHQ